MNVTLPSADEIDRYGVTMGPPAARRTRIPLIADEEEVCLVRTPQIGGGAYWSRGDVDVHVLYARQAFPGGGAVHPHGGHQAWLAQALRERRELRRHLLRGGLHTTAGGLLVLREAAQLVIPDRQ